MIHVQVDFDSWYIVTSVYSSQRMCPPDSVSCLNVDHAPLGFDLLKVRPILCIQTSDK